MKEEDRNKKRALSEFKRYVRGEMTKRDENAFQRKLQIDPFADEATEGFSEITPGEADKDMKRLGKRLKNRIRPVRRVVLYRVAASIAVLMLISSAFLIIQRYKTDKQISENIISPVVVERKDSAPPSLPMVAEKVNEAVAEPSEAVSMITDESADKSVTAPAETIVATSKDTTELLAVAEEPDSEPDITTEQAAIQEAAPLMATRMQEMPAANATRSEVKSRPDSSVAPSAELIVAGYGTAKKAEAVKTGFISAQPVTGSSNFETYISENIRRPQSLPQGERAIAVVSFLVRSTGAIDSLKVVNSPGDEFATEAMRLIREGPAWKPAQENGQPVDDEVQVRLVFR